VLAAVLIKFGQIRSPTVRDNPARVISTPTTLSGCWREAGFITSVGGVLTFLVLSTHHYGSIAPDWGVGIALGIGGLLGGYTGARFQPHLPESAIRRLLGLLVLAIAHAMPGSPLDKLRVCYPAIPKCCTVAPLPGSED
jgi:hypothetical protein